MLRAEIQADLKRPAILMAAGLQVFALSLLCYLTNPVIGGKLWNSLFWLTVVFTTLQAVSKSFLQINRARWIYLNQLAGPAAIIISKVVYNWTISMVFAIANLAAFVFFSGNPVNQMWPYMGFIILVSTGFGTVFTLMSAVASKTTQAGFLLPVLSLPVILPLLLIGVQGSVKCLNTVLVPSTYTDMLLLLALDFLILVLAGILFQPLWRD